MDHPEICGKHKFDEARTWTEDAIDQQTQLRNTCIETDLTIPNKKCNWSQQLPFNPQNFPTLTCGSLSQNIGFESFQLDLSHKFKILQPKQRRWVAFPGTVSWHKEAGSQVRDHKFPLSVLPICEKYCEQLVAYLWVTTVPASYTLLASGRNARRRYERYAVKWKVSEMCYHVHKT